MYKDNRMEILFANNTLTNPAEAVKGKRFTRQDLLAAADAFFARHELVRVSVSDEAAPYVVAYGVHMVDEKRGYGVRLELGPSACGTGIVYESRAIMNFGATWSDEVELKKGVSGRHRWSTSTVLIQMGQPRDCDPEYMRALRSKFYKVAKMRARAAQSRQAVADTATRLFGAPVALMSGTDFTVQVLEAEQKPEILITIRTIDEAKAQAILAILNK